MTLAHMFVCLAACGVAAAQPARTRPAQRAEVPAVLAQPAFAAVGASTKEWNAARSAAAGALDNAISAYQSAPNAANAAAMTTAAADRRLVEALSGHSPKSRAATLAFLREHPRLATTLAFLITKDDVPAGVFSLLDRLRETRADDLDTAAALASALCVVHDKPFERRVNENKARSADPTTIYDYFRRHSRDLILDPTVLPAELLVYVVDTTATIDEMEWALNKYKKSANLGDRYKEVPYDTAHFRAGAPKKATGDGWNLRSILSAGGVCADQAYFACTVGKAQGVPTAYVTGRSADVGHAWLGYLRGKAWDFSSGRYDDYKNVRGEVIDPQTGKRIADGKISILAEFIAEKRAIRWESLALSDAARRLMEIEKMGPAGTSPATSTAAQLALIDAALKRAPANTAAWDVIEGLARAKKLTLADKTRWADTLFDLCGKNYPDFAFEILKPMIAGEESAADQDRLWNSAFGSFKNRPDLAAEVRFLQADAWQKAGNKSKAWTAYNDVIDKFVNDGPAAVRAAASIRTMLDEEGKSAEVVKLYGNAWKRCQKPTTMAPGFARQSNWFQLGFSYAEALAKEGRSAEASNVMETIGAG